MSGPSFDQGEQPVVHEDLRPDSWLRELLIAFYVFAMGVVFALNFPEPVKSIERKTQSEQMPRCDVALITECQP